MAISPLPAHGAAWDTWAADIDAAARAGIGGGGGGGGSTLAVAATVSTSGTLLTAKHNPVDATSGTRAMALPTGAAAGTLLAVEKTDATANTVTVTGNVRGVGGTVLTLFWQNEALLLAADTSGSWWPIAGHKTKTSLDAAYDAAGAATTARAFAIQRANHTGTQAIGTVTGLQTALDAKLDSTAAASTYVAKTDAIDLESTQDSIAGMFTGGTHSGISFAYNDPGNVINATVTPGAVADATTTSKGAVQLAGDLAGTAAAPTVPGLTGKLTAASNLSDVANAATARTNLGLGSAATQPTTAFDAAGAAAAVLPSQTGNSGKALTTNGSVASWTTISGGGGGASFVTVGPTLAPQQPGSGLWSAAMLPGVGVAQGTGNQPTGRCFAVPVVFSAAASINALALGTHSSGDAASFLRAGIYADNGSFYPGTLLTDAGQLAATSSTLTYTLGTPVALSAWTIYWAVMAFQGAYTTCPNVKASGAGGNPITGLYGYPQSDVAGNILNGGSSAGWWMPGITGAFPATFPALSTAQFTNGGTGINTPIIAMRAA